MDRIARLEAIEAIRNLKAKYFRCLDMKAWDELPEVFTQGMRVLTPDGKTYAESGAQYAALLQNSLADCVSCHQGLTAEIEILDGENARGIWAMQDVITWNERHPTFGWKGFVGRGHYHETYRFEDGAWRIDTLTLTRLRLDEEWPEDDPRSGKG